MIQTTQYHPQSPLPYHFPHDLSQINTPNHIEVAGMQVELRYKSGAPSLQQKVIQLCNQSLLN